ncbi:MAG: DUF2786 domain-containing protein [Candidatus Ornithospirochaeta sp.]
MDQTIRVTGEKETEVRARLAEVEHSLKNTIRRRWYIDYPIYKAFFFVVFTEKDKLGEFDSQQKIILLSEDLIYQDFSVLKNVFLHEAAHALDSALNGYSSGGHTPRFREYCAALGVEDGFDKAKVKHKLEEDAKVKERMAKLMAMSSSPFENEAMVALSKARKLLLENSELLNKDEKREDKIYDVELFEGGRIPTYATRLAQFVGKATGVYILKLLGTENGSVLKAYGSLDEVEAALYLFGNLLSSLDEEITKLRKEGYKVTKDAFVLGACPEMEKKLRKEDSSSDNALVTIQNENKSRTHRLCFKNDGGFRRSTSHTKYDPKSMMLGQEFGKSMDISSTMGRKEIKN